MPDRLMGDLPYQVNVNGVIVNVKPTSIAEKRRLATSIKWSELTDENFDRYVEVIASRIESIEGFSGTPRDYLMNHLQWIEQIIDFQKAVLSVVQLREFEVKNFVSLPDGSSSSDPVREQSTTQENAQVEPQGSALPTNKVSLSPSAVTR